MKVKQLQDIEGNNIYPLSSMNTVIDDQGNPLQQELYQYRDEIKRLSKIPLTKAGDGTLYLANDGKYKELPPVNVNEQVHITLSSNQDQKDILGATITIDLEGGSQETYIWNGNVITLDLIYGTDYTISVSNIEGYATPESKTFTAQAANTRRIEMVYTASVILFDSNVLAQVLVNDQLINTNETIKVPFGNTVNIVPQDLEGYTAPQSITIIADAINKEVVLSYIQSVLEINILSNQTNDEAIQNASVNVSYNDTTVEVKNGFTAVIPINSEITIQFPEIEGYKKPEDIVFTYTGGYVKKTGIYYTELLTVNVSADQGSVSGFEVTISKQEVVGVATKYTRLEYIESTGTQYIDTGFKPNQDTKVSIDAQYTSRPTNNNLCLFGARTSSTSNSYYWIYTTLNTCRSGYNASFNYEWQIDPTERRVITKDKNITTVDGVSHSWSYAKFQCVDNMTLFAMNQAGTIQWHACARVYSCQIYDNGVLIRDYIPALRSDGIAGLYDAVNDVFYAPSGSGNFIAGGESGEVIAAQTSVTGSYKIPFGISYTITASRVNGYITPSTITRTASTKSYTASVLYKIDTVRDLSMYDIYGNTITQTTANCYVIKESGTYKLPLVFGNALKNGAINSAAYTKNSGSYSHDFVDYNGTIVTSPYIENVSGVAASAQLSIADTDGIFTDISIVDGSPCRYLQFKVASVPITGANGVLSIKNSSGVIMWSWHIWVWADDLSVVEITNKTSVKYKILPVNLASKWDDTAKTKIKNWFYQWGRPTPTLCPSSHNSTSNHTSYGVLSYATANIASDIQTGIKNPATFYKHSSSNNYNWFRTNSSKTYNLWDAACTSASNSDNNVVKTIYDPCPIGFKMPNGNTFTYFSTSNVVGSFANGWKFKRYSGDTVGVFFPASGSRSPDTGSLNGASSNGCVWLSSAFSQSDFYCFSFSSSYVNTNGISTRASGYSVRPVQDEDLELAPHELLIEVPNVNGFTVTITNDSEEILATQTDSLQLHSIPWGTTYTITCSDKAGYITPEPQTYVASVSRRELQLNYIKQPSVSVNIKSNQPTDNLTIKAKLYRGSEVVGNIGNGDSYVFSGTEYNWKLVFPEIEGYKTPDPIEFEWYGLEDVQLEATYQCELLTVNVSANQGSVSGFEVTIAKQETVGVAAKFVKLDYIEANGNQYLDTGIAPSDDLEVEISFKPTSSVTEGAIFGSDWSTTGYFLMYYNSKWRFHTRGYVFDSSSSIDTSKFTTLKTSTSSITIDDTKNTWSKGSSTDASANILLFYANGSYTAKKYGWGQVAYMKMWKGGSLVRDFVPAMRSDGIAGLYDAVNDKFYASNGSSNFIAGGEHEEVIATQTSVIGSYKIPFDASYVVKASAVNGYSTPTVQSFTASQLSRDCNMIYKKEPGTSNPSFGVYIQATNGKCYTKNEWGEVSGLTPNGIAVITDNCRFVMALACIENKQIYNNSSVVPNLTSKPGTSASHYDYSGKSNTDILIQSYGSGSTYAAGACVNYVFPNGNKGYIGAHGEWAAFYSNRAGIVDLYNLLGSSIFTFGGNWWTSTYCGLDGSEVYFHVAGIDSGRYLNTNDDIRKITHSSTDIIPFTTI